MFGLALGKKGYYHKTEEYVRIFWEGSTMKVAELTVEEIKLLIVIAEKNKNQEVFAQETFKKLLNLTS